MVWMRYARVYLEFLVPIEVAALEPMDLVARLPRLVKHVPDVDEIIPLHTGLRRPPGLDHGCGG